MHLDTRVRSHLEVEEPGPRRSEEESNHPHHREGSRLVNPTKFEFQGGDGLLDRKANAHQRVPQESQSEATILKIGAQKRKPRGDMRGDDETFHGREKHRRPGRIRECEDPSGVRTRRARRGCVVHGM